FWPWIAMHITQLNRECLLHLFSFLDKSSRKSLGQTCQRLLEVFQDPSLWSLLSFHSPVELKKDNFLLGAALKYLSICWHSSRVKVCNIEDWMKSSFQKDICSKHENTVNEFLLQVCNRRRGKNDTAFLFSIWQEHSPRVLHLHLGRDYIILTREVDSTHLYLLDLDFYNAVA
uniref:F-box and leucine rich repeat protein 22 n=1 Tax=Crocodylus porosus TaxID=8502 RepID=A0A7M4FWC5_CROPO